MKKPGKKFDKWKYHSKDGLMVEVPVRLIKAGRRGEQTQGVSFRVEMEDPPIREEDTDIEALRKKVFEKLDEFFTVEWEPYFHVWVDGEVQLRKKYKEETVEEGTAQITVRFEEVQLGVASGDRPAWRHFRGSSDVHEGRPQIGPAKFYHSRTYALVPATEENRVALVGFSNAFDALLDRIRKFLHPDQIELSLQTAALTSIRLLPSAEDDPPSVRL